MLAMRDLDENDARRRSLSARGMVLAFFCALGLWTVVWWLKVHFVDPRVEIVRGGLGAVLFWMLAKLMFWIGPAFAMMKASGATQREIFNLGAWRAWLFWGLALGIAIGLTGWLQKAFRGEPILPAEWSPGSLSAVLIAPAFEEYYLRGAVFMGLRRQGVSLALSVTLSALLFVLLHVPGWYFMGTLTRQLMAPGGALSIAVVGAMFGYATERGRSVMGGVIAHFLNNLSAA